jgi:hypothetical protein
VFTFRAGQSIKELAADTLLEVNREREFVHMHAYAKTRVGWALNVGVGFTEDDRLCYISLSNFREEDVAADALPALAETTGCLGDYTKRMHLTWFKIREAKGNERVDALKLERNWGSVTVFLEDSHNPRFSIHWPR